MKSFLSAFLLVFLVATYPMVAQNDLGYNLSTGDIFKVYQVANQDIIQNMNDSEHQLKNVLEGDYTFVVDDVNDSLYSIKFRYDRFKMSITSNMLGEIMSINTRDSIAEDDIEGKIFSKLMGVDLTMEMYKNGKIKSIKGAEAMITNMVNAAGDFDEFTKELMKESMKKEFSNESLATSFEQMTYIYSATGEVTNDSWTNQFIGDLSAENTWNLVTRSDKDIAINGESTIVLKTKDDDIEMNLAGQMTSKVVVSPETGFITHMITNSTAKGHSIMHNMNDLKVPTTVTSNINYKIEKHVQ